MTFAEFERLPDPPNGRRYELHHGELVEVAPPKHRHHRIQRRLLFLLQEIAKTTGSVTMELGYRPAPEHEYWTADVAFVSQTRWEQIPADGNLEGPPELVVEVLSPSNSAAEIREKRKLCLENGSAEFWVVDPDQREIEVWTPDGRSITYGASERIPLFFASGAWIGVGEVFE